MLSSAKYILVFFLLYTFILPAQTINVESAKHESVNVSMYLQKFFGKKSVRVVKNHSVKEVDEPTFLVVGSPDFLDGTIEVNVLSGLLQDAPDFARGFIGVAFRINGDHLKFECLYIRPTNGRAQLTS